MTTTLQLSEKLLMYAASVFACWIYGLLVHRPMHIDLAQHVAARSRLPDVCRSRLRKHIRKDDVGCSDNDQHICLDLSWVKSSYISFAQYCLGKTYTQVISNTSIKTVYRMR